MHSRYPTGLLVLLSASLLLLSFPAYIHFAAMHLPGFPLPPQLETIGFVGARLSLAFAAFMAVLALIFAALHWREAATVKGASALVLTLAVLTMGPFWYYRANITENRVVTAEKIVEHTSSVPTPVYFDTTKIEIRQLPTDNPIIQRMYNKDNFRQEVLQNFSDFHDYLSGLYETAEPYMSKQWGLDSEKLKRSVFYAMAVGTLFEYGNKTRLDMPGCSYWNERIGGKLGYQQSQRQLLQAGIGCCDDYAYVLKAMLDRDGIDSHLLAGGGHIWVEMTVDGNKFNIDANTGLLVAAGWDELDTAKKIVVWNFPLAGAMPSSGERYRPILGSFVTYTLDRISDGGFPVDIHPMPDFPLEDGVPPDEVTTGAPE